MTPISPQDVAERLALVQQRIVSAGGDPERVRVCAVTKGFGVDAIRAAVAVGIDDIGENYAQEMIAKRDELSGDPAMAHIRWHMIGRLQRNKVKPLASLVHQWHSVDRIEVAQTIARHAAGARVLVQVNATAEPDKGGFAPDSVAEAVAQMRALDLDVRGLMAVGPTDPTVDAAPGFEATASLAMELGLPELSMGMTGDLEAAVAAGSTMVRIGTALFGPRPERVTSLSASHG